MVKAILITIGSWLIGSLFLLTDGQYFTHNMVWLGCCVVAALPWFWQMSRRYRPLRRFFAALVITMNLALAVRFAADLPDAWRKQHRFRSVATPNQPLNLSVPPQRHRSIIEGPGTCGGPAG